MIFHFFYYFLSSIKSATASRHSSTPFQIVACARAENKVENQVDKAKDKRKECIQDLEQYVDIRGRITRPRQIHGIDTHNHGKDVI